MTTPPSATPPAGWYPDPAGAPGSRWWDGQAWTEQRQPAADAAGSPAAPAATPWQVPPPGQQVAGGAPPQQAPYAPGAYGTVPLGGTWGYGYVAPTTEKGATTSMVLGIVSLFCCGVLLGPAAIYEGVKARKKIAASNGALIGDGMALAGIIIGAIGVAGWAIYILFVIIGANTSP